MPCLVTTLQRALLQHRQPSWILLDPRDLLSFMAQLPGLPGLGDLVLTQLSGVCRKTKHILAVSFYYSPIRD